MRQLKAKLRSRRGASITFALLLFLVCAVISGVVIVAASTVGGRMSGMRETDERYYAATEAARALQAIFVGDGTAITPNEAVEVTYSKTDDSYQLKTANDVNALLAAASKAVVKEALTGASVAMSGIPTVTDDKYTCTVTPSLDNGLLSFEISASGPSEGKNNGTYKLTIVFASNLKMPEATGAASAKATVSWSLHSLSKGRALQATNDDSTD